MPAQSLASFDAAALTPAALQSPVGEFVDLGPDLRANTDVVLALKEPILANRKKLHEAYFGQADLKTFDACFARATEAWGAMVLNNTLPEPADHHHHRGAQRRAPPCAARRPCTAAAGDRGTAPPSTRASTCWRDTTTRA